MSLSVLKEIVTLYIEGAESPDLRAYGAGFVQNFERNVRVTRHIMDLGKMRCARVFDLGCGFGWYALLVSLLGDNDVVANDIRPLMTQNIELRMAAIGSEFDVKPRVETLCGDFVGVDIPDGSFDAIFCNQTIEHVHDLEACFRRAHAILKPGGIFVITNDNNCLTLSQFRKIEEMWKKRDTSWEYIEQLKRERPEENKDIQPYALMREGIVRRKRRDLDEDSVRLLVEATAGQTEAEIDVSVVRYAATGELPQRPTHSWCRNPVTGEYCERQLDPFELKRQLCQLGFRTRLLQGFQRGGPLRLTCRLDLPLINRILFRIRPRFILAARKL